MSITPPIRRKNKIWNKFIYDSTFLMIRLQIEEEKLLLCEHAYVCGWVYARAFSVFLFPLIVIVGVLLMYPRTPES